MYHKLIFRSCANFLFKSRLPPLNECQKLFFSDFANTFKYSDLNVVQCKPNQMGAKPDPDNLVFGASFSDHMLEIEWDVASGWSAPQIVPMHNFDLHPAAKVLHYAQEIFEGMKAYRSPENKILLFRPEMNMKRFRGSADRACLPGFEEKELLKLIQKLVSIDQEWVPYHKSSTLYIRPTLIGIEPTLGVTASKKALLYVITGPVGPYYKSGIKPVSLLADPKYVRAWPGGPGDRKLGCNYAPTLAVQQVAEKLNLHQVLWLFGPEHRITEVGAMNIFIYLRNENNQLELVTPPLDGIILPGVTRDSILALTREWKDFTVSERNITMKELLKALKEGRLLEVFGAGTACVVSPVGKIYYMDKEYKIPTSNEKQLWSKILTSLTDIQYGRSQHKWSLEV